MSLIGAAIQVERNLAGLTNKQIAEMTGLSQQYVGDVQLGRRIPAVETMLLFANLFPHVDSAGWAWLVLRDLWGEEIATTMRQYAARQEEGGAPNYKALYFELAEQVCLVERTKAAAFDGQADGKQFWEAQGRLNRLVGVALSWRDHPDLYAELLARKEERIEREAHPDV
jgi:transcriptional regulator with XRE-family HTH domain